MFDRPAGYEDVNDADRLGLDPRAAPSPRRSSGLFVACILVFPQKAGNIGSIFMSFLELLVWL